MRVRREILGDDYVDRAVESTTDFTAEFQQLLTSMVWGEIWTRDGLDRRTKSCMLVMAMAALNRPFELEQHLQGAVRNGVTHDELKEVLILTAFYCGMPAANAAFKIANRVLGYEGPPAG